MRRLGSAESGQVLETLLDGHLNVPPQAVQFIDQQVRKHDGYSVVSVTV